jgi:hypothetical protein
MNNQEALIQYLKQKVELTTPNRPEKAITWALLHNLSDPMEDALREVFLTFKIE